jgi:hypothetical protein
MHVHSGPVDALGCLRKALPCQFAAAEALDNLRQQNARRVDFVTDNL